MSVRQTPMGRLGDKFFLLERHMGHSNSNDFDGQQDKQIEYDYHECTTHTWDVYLAKPDHTFYFDDIYIT